MKILFLCGSLEPGHDGVGDYTRRLCGELSRNGHAVHILSLCDHHVITFTSDHQENEGSKVDVNRIPLRTSNIQRCTWSQSILNELQPDLVSLQFVPYSFNTKGLPFWLPSFLMKLRGNHQWHIMFHELWLGIDIESSFKHKFIGKLQQLIINRLIHKIRPQFITTQNQLYQFFLQSHNIVVDILPICSNIPLTAVKKKENLFTQFVLFGTIHSGAPFEEFIRDLIIKKNKLNKPLKFIFIGKNGIELSHYTTVLENYNIYYEVIGIQSENEISRVLMDSDYGISTTPYFQTEKSGIYAAYREHQVNTICVARQWTPRNGQYVIPQIIKYEKNNLNLFPVDVEGFDLSSMTKQFINSISKT